ncbi:hypothetical protein MRX96_030941 [Rhipicephalus microplus]
MCQLARDAGGTHPVETLPPRVHLPVSGSPLRCSHIRDGLPSSSATPRGAPVSGQPGRQRWIAPMTPRRHWPATGQPGWQWVDAQKGRALALLGIGGDHTAGHRSLGVAPGTLAAGHVGRGASS